jgi:hypothetical protein
LKNATKYLLVAGLVLVVAAIGVTSMTSTSKEHSHLEASTSTAASNAAPSQTTTAQPSTSTPATQTTPDPAITTPPSAPKPLLPQIAKIEEQMHNTPMNRPMNQVAKDWLGCRSEQSYNDTMDMLTHKNPAAAGQFQGTPAACVKLSTGQHIKVLSVDQTQHVVKIQVEGQADELWTDPAALAGQAPNNPGN